jgi:telomere length regulation protein
MDFVAGLIAVVCASTDRVASATLLSIIRSNASVSSPKTPKPSPSKGDPFGFLDGVWHAVASLVSSDSAATERWTEALLRAADRASLNDSAAEALLWALFGRLLHSSPSVQQLLTDRLLVHRVLPLRCLRWLVRFVIVNPPPNPGQDPDSKSGRVLAQTAQLWGAPDFVRNAPLQQQSQVSAALALGVSGFSKEGLERTPDLLSSLLQGVSTRLDSPIWDTRGLGMRVATAFSMVLDPKNPLVFDEEVKVTGEDDWSWEDWNINPRDETKALAQLERGRAAWEREASALLNDLSEGRVSETTASRAAVERDGSATASGSGRESPLEKRRSDLILNNDAELLEDIVLPGAFTPTRKTPSTANTPNKPLIEELSAAPEEPDSDDDSVTSLQPYDLDDDMEDLAGGKVPTQLRECAAALRKKDECEGCEKALAAAEGLVRAGADELGDVSLEVR